MFTRFSFTEYRIFQIQFACQFLCVVKSSKAKKSQWTFHFMLLLEDRRGTTIACTAMIIMLNTMIG